MSLPLMCYNECYACYYHPYFDCLGVHDTPTSSPCCPKKYAKKILEVCTTTVVWKKAATSECCKKPRHESNTEHVDTTF